MSRTYCHTHSAYDCQTCADEILSLGIQVDKDRIAALERELERLRKDAERYRWLRDPSVYVGKVIDKVAGYEPMTELGTGGYPIYEYRAGSELDEAIDAAIAQEPKK